MARKLKGISRVGKRFKVSGAKVTLSKQDIKKDIRNTTKVKLAKENLRHKKRLRNIKKEEKKTRNKFGV